MLLAIALTAHLVSGSGVELQEGYRAGNRFFFIASPIPGGVDRFGRPIVLESVAAAAFIELAAAAASEGVAIEVNYGFRTFGQQAQLYREQPNLTAEPGHSAHQSGRAVDISLKSPGGRKNPRASVVYKWLRANAKTFGFYEAVAGEPWHWQFSPTQGTK